MNDRNWESKPEPPGDWENQFNWETGGAGREESSIRVGCSRGFLVFILLAIAVGITLAVLAHHHVI